VEDSAMAQLKKLNNSISIAETNLKNCRNIIYPGLQFCCGYIKGKIGGLHVYEFWYPKE
jgi:hypothetical protein